MTLLLAAATLARAEDPVPSAGAWEPLARSTLLRALHVERPDIAEWTIEVRVSERQRDQLADAVIDEAVVTQIGARSAVRLRWRTEARRRMTTVWFATRGLGAVFVAKEKLSVHDALRPDSGHWLVRDVMGLNCDPVTDAQTLAGKRTKVPLRQDEPICRDKVESIPPVTKGRPVTVQSFAGPVVVTGKAIAQSDGRLGERLKVKSSSSGVVYSAVVTGEQQVSVYD